MRCGRKKGSTTLSQHRTKVHRGQRHEAMEEEESSPAESDSSDQGGTVNAEPGDVVKSS